jgi:thioester reductase-like protein
MDESMVEAIVRRAGLEKALERYPDDVAAAATSAEKATDRIRRSSGTLSEPLLEPWPPMMVVGR